MPAPSSECGMTPTDIASMLCLIAICLFVMWGVYRMFRPIVLSMDADLIPYQMNGILEVRLRPIFFSDYCHTADLFLDQYNPVAIAPVLYSGRCQKCDLSWHHSEEDAAREHYRGLIQAERSRLVNAERYGRVDPGMADVVERKIRDLETTRDHTISQFWRGAVDRTNKIWEWSFANFQREGRR